MAHTSREPKPPDFFHPEALADYLDAARQPDTIVGMCEDYRAAATIDLEHDRASRSAGLKVQCPMLGLWGAKGVLDDVDLPFGRLRMRANGSAGTHNGLRSIVDRFGTRDFSRLRLGVGRGDARRDLADHVLATFDSGERAVLDPFIARAADVAEMFAAEGIVKAMNTYNPEPADPDVT
jgi:hypothetical protein